MSNKKRNSLERGLGGIRAFIAKRIVGVGNGTGGTFPEEAVDDTEKSECVGGENSGALPEEGVGSISGNTPGGGAALTAQSTDSSYASIGAQTDAQEENETADTELDDGASIGEAPIFEGSEGLCELMESYPELDVEALLSDSGFVLYCRRYGGSLLEKYEGYRHLVDALGVLCDSDNAADNSKDALRARRMMSSTAFSKSSASPDADAGFELTPLQREVARRAGLSYREYSAMLRDVPRRDSIKKSSIK